MSRIDDLIAKLCPDGVEFKTLGEVSNKNKNINWSENNNTSTFQYIDLSSVDRIAQTAASKTILDGMHRIPINPSQAVIQAKDGAWLVAPVVGDHRDKISPIFIDGDFFRRSGLAVWGTRLDGGDALHAIVGVDNLLDFRNQRRIATAVPIKNTAS